MRLDFSRIDPRTLPRHSRGWISGFAIYHSRPSWKLDCNGEYSIILPSVAGHAVMMLFIGVAIIFVGLGIYLAEPELSSLLILILAAPTAVMCIWIAFVLFREQHRGPYLLYNHKSGTLSLPRHSIALSSSAAYQFQVIIGNTTGDGVTTTKRQSSVAELQILTPIDHDSVSIPVVGWLVSESIDAHLASLAHAFNRPIDIIRQPGTIITNIKNTYNWEDRNLP